MKTRRIMLVTLVLLIGLILYHLVADRFTPYTSQANVDTFLVQIAPEISGTVVSVDIRDNTRVRKGQVLFRIDPVPFEIALRAAEAALAVTSQGVDTTAADLGVADAQLKRQRIDLAVSQELGKIVLDLAAKRALAETAAIRARAEISRSQAEIGTAEAEAARARIKLGGVGDANVQIHQARIAVEQARLDLQRTQIVAPADGVVTNLRLAPGQYANKGQPLLSFIADGPRWVSAAMRENQLGRIVAGNRAYIAFDDRPGEVYLAHVDSVGWGIAQGDEAPTGQLPQVDSPSGWLRDPQRFPVRIVLDTPSDPSLRLALGRSGAQANVVVLTRDRSVMNPLARLWIRAVAWLSYLR